MFLRGGLGLFNIVGFPWLHQLKMVCNVSRNYLKVAALWCKRSVEIFRTDWKIWMKFCVAVMLL
jgi:hypothetical protein